MGILDLQGLCVLGAIFAALLLTFGSFWLWICADHFRVVGMVREHNLVQLHAFAERIRREGRA